MGRTSDPEFWVAAESVCLPQPTAAFGHTAFVESLLRISLQYLSGSGVAVQSAAPAGVKCLWLIAFLHYHFDKQECQHRDAKSSGAHGFSAGGYKRPAELPQCANYNSCITRLMDASPDLFEQWLDVDEGHECSTPGVALGRDAALAKKTCRTCARKRSRRGVGSIFCHGCSGVDDRPL